MSPIICLIFFQKDVANQFLNSFRRICPAIIFLALKGCVSFVYYKFYQKKCFQHCVYKYITYLTVFCFKRVILSVWTFSRVYCALCAVCFMPKCATKDFLYSLSLPAQNGYCIGYLLRMDTVLDTCSEWILYWIPFIP